MTVYILIATCNLALWSNTINEPGWGKEYTLRQGNTMEEAVSEYHQLHGFCKNDQPAIYKYQDGVMTQIDFSSVSEKP